MRLKCFFLLVFLILAASPAWATTYYVAKTGSNSNNGQFESGTPPNGPFLTILKCYTTLVENNNAGDKCQVKNGTYQEEVVVYSGVLLQGTQANPIILENYPGHSPIIDGSTVNIGPNVCCIGFRPNAPTTTAHRVSWFIFRGFEIRNFLFSGVSCLNCDHVVFENNYIHHVGNYRVNTSTGGNGIIADGPDNTIRRNRIHSVGPLVNPRGHGLYLSGNNYTITNNLIYDTVGIGIQFRTDAPVARMPNATYAGVNNALVANNTIAYTDRNGSVVFSNFGAGATVTGSRWINNLFYENGQTVEGTAGCAHAMSWPSNAVQWLNNVSYCTPLGANVFMVFAPGLTPANCVGCIVNANCPAGTNFATVVTSWCTTNPNLQNAPSATTASPDLRPTATSAILLDKGLNLSACGITTDFAGNARPSGGGTCTSPTGTPWEVGAYEFGGGPPPDTTPPAPPTGVTITKLEALWP